MKAFIGKHVHADQEAPVTAEWSSQVQRQALREKSIGLKRVERYRSKENKADRQLDRSAQQLLEEAILSLLVGSQTRTTKTIGNLRQHLRTTALRPVQDALRELLAARRGKPSNLKSFWILLELPANIDAHHFNEFSEIVFYSTLNEMLLSVLTSRTGTGTNDDIAVADPESEDAAEEDTEESSASSTGSTVDWPWIPERQLYQRVWQSFLLNLVDWLSRGEVSLPSWLANAARAKVDGIQTFTDLDFEAHLEAAFQSALNRPAFHSPRPRNSPLDAVRKAQSIKNADQIKTIAEVQKPFTEAAEEFAATLVNIVASVTGDDIFVWFRREQPIREDGKVMRRTLASWVPTKTLLDRIKAIPNAPDIYSIPVNAPLIAPPKPWRVDALHQGGYYTRRIGFYKFYLKNDQIRDFLQACRTPEIVPVLNTVNQIQLTPFRINQRVWAVINAMLQRVDELTRTPRRKNRVEISFDSYLRTTFSPRAFNRKEGEKVGDRLRWPLTRKMVEELAHPDDDGQLEPFYFAYNADTRGRLYPMFQWLSPQGEDLSRALLEFAQGKPLTDPGAACLAIHGSQQVAFETILRDLEIDEERPLTLKERRQWIDMHEPNIRQYAAAPLTYMGWAKTKNPYLFLAFCFAWVDYLENGAGTISHLPVHVDGVCNGLQHIAALTGDSTLAAATNLQPGPPRDIYLQVKQLALAQLMQSVADDPYAAFAMEHRLIDRELTKAVVMIIPYGAGDRGTAKAVRGRLRGRMFQNKRSFEETTALGQSFLSFLHKTFPDGMSKTTTTDGRRIQPVAVHLTKLALTIANAFTKQLAEHFPAIGTFKRELVSSANAVIDCGQPMLWQAPSGLPVMQRSFRVSDTVVDCRISSVAFGTLDLSRKKYGQFHERIKFTGQRIANEINVRDQQAGILPNFIHSLDAAHLIRTAQLAVSRGISNFSVIHDSYGTHAADMPSLAACIREAFVSIYSDRKVPLLTRFLRWCAVLSIAARAPQIQAEQFEPYIDLTATEKALYALVARWAGRDSLMLREMAREIPRLVEEMLEKGQSEISNNTIKKLLVFAADKIELEWPSTSGVSDLSGCLKSEYFFS